MVGRLYNKMRKEEERRRERGDMMPKIRAAAAAKIREVEGADQRRICRAGRRLPGLRLVGDGAGAARERAALPLHELRGGDLPVMAARLHTALPQHPRFQLLDRAVGKFPRDREIMLHDGDDRLQRVAGDARDLWNFLRWRAQALSLPYRGDRERLGRRSPPLRIAWPTKFGIRRKSKVVLGCSLGSGDLDV